MTVVIVIMLIFGAICICASFFINANNSDNISTQNNTIEKRTLSENEKDDIRTQINELIEEQLKNIDDKTEASLDKISNTKILEMNEYADTIMNEISRNHNETVFLYDMLNEKAKEVKGTVKNVNMAKKSMQSNDKMVSSQIEKSNNIGKISNTDNDEQRKKAIMSNSELQRNDKILELFKIGQDEKQIAKELSMGIGEVRLVLGLYKSDSEH